VAYKTALGHLPPRKRTLNQSADSDPSVATDDAEAPTDDDDKSPQNVQAEPPSMLESECSKARAILNANIAACLIKLVSSDDLHQATKVLILVEQNDSQGVIDACTHGIIYFTWREKHV